MAPGCVVKLSEKNSPIAAGGVTGEPANCSQVQAIGVGGPGTGEPAQKLVGRYDMTDPQRPKFDWSGNYLTARFEGSEVSVGISVPDGQDADFVFEAVVDQQTPVKFVVTPSQPSYLLAKDLPPGPHEVLVMRNSEALYGITQFTGFNFGASGKLLPPTERPRRIELIGDSITCGYGIEGTNATCPYDVEVRPGVRLPITQNIYLAYGSAAGRALDADVVTTCYSGKGLRLNYRENETDRDKTTTIPQFWERTLANRNDMPWSFQEPEPQVVVINVGTNDFSRDVNQDTIADGIDLGAFHDTYLQFLQAVRARRPDAHIFIAVPPMMTDKFPLDNARTDLKNILGRLVDERAAAGDTKVYRIELVEMGSRYGLGCDYHPNLEVHQIMTQQLVEAIRSKTCW